MKERVFVASTEKIVDISIDFSQLAGMHQKNKNSKGATSLLTPNMSFGACQLKQSFSGANNKPPIMSGT